MIRNVGATLMVAAGGGGDAVAAVMVANGPTYVATWAWERLIVDPVPGPRALADFSGLIERVDDVAEIVAGTTPHRPSRSSLPRVASELPARFFLLDPTAGTVGVARQLRAIADHIGATEIMLVDVGGDLLATGDEPELRSPLADAVALAACHSAGIPFTALVCGPGLDGELPEHQVLEKCARLGATPAPAGASRVDRVRHVLSWHPSEVTTLFVASILGARGQVEIRDGGTPVLLTDESTMSFAIAGERLYSHNRLANLVESSRSLDEIETVIRAERGTTEIDYERSKAKRLETGHSAINRADLPTAIGRELARARERRVEFVTSRRLAELVTASTGMRVDLSVLAALRPSTDLPLWRT